MAASFVKSARNRSGGAAFVEKAFATDVVAGNTIAAFIRWTGAVTLDHVDDTVNSGVDYQIVHNPTNGNGHKAAIAYFINTAGGANTVRATFSGTGGAFLDIILHELHGDSGLEYDASDASYGENLGSGANAWDPACAATFTAGAIVSAFIIDEGYDIDYTAGTGYTLREDAASLSSESQVFAAGGSLAAKFTSNNGFEEALVGIIGFREPVASGHPAVKRMGGVQGAHRIGGGQLSPSMRIW